MITDDEIKELANYTIKNDCHVYYKQKGDMHCFILNDNGIEKVLYSSNDKDEYNTMNKHFLDVFIKQCKGSIEFGGVFKC